MTGVPCGAASLHGHWIEPSCVELGVGHAGEGRRQRRDLVHDLGRVRVAHRVAERVRERHRRFPIAERRRAAGSPCGRGLMRRSALVKVPSFSRNDEPGRKTCAYFAVSFRKRSCTTTHSIACEAGGHVLRVGIGLRDVLALDVDALESAIDRLVEHVRDAQARLVRKLQCPRAHRKRCASRRRRCGGSREARAGTSPCRRRPARCSGRAAGSRRRRRGRYCRSPSRGSPCP